MISFKRSDIPAAPFLACVSGGIDSISGAALLAKRGFNFSIIHVNNRLIPQDDEAAQKVNDFAKFLNKKLYLIESSEVYSCGSVEAHCRDERYRAIQLVAKQYGYSDALTFHHLGDAVESYFINFMKGYPEYQPIPPVTHYPNVTIRRPFLGNEKQEFQDYAMKNNLEEFITEDELNLDMSLQRNWVRNVILPLIKERTNLNKVVRKKFLLKK